MLGVGFWALFLSTSLFAAFLLRISGERVNKISLINVTALSIYLFSVIGTIPLFYYWDSYRYETGIQDKIIITKVLFYSCLNLVFFLFGAIFLRKVVGLRSRPFLSSQLKSITALQRISLFMLFLLCALVLKEYLSRLDRIAIFAVFLEGPAEAMVARSDMGNNFAGKYHWFEFFMHNIGTFLTFATFSYWLTRKNLVSFLGFLVTFFYSVFVAVMAIEKSPLAWLLIGLFMVYHVTRHGEYVKVNSALPFLMFLFFLLGLLYIFFMGAQDISSALLSVFSRAFSGSISPAYFYLEFFPNHQEYLLGRTFPNPGGFFPYEPYLYTIEVMNWVFPWHIDQGVVGTAPTVFWGEAYANFGPVGIPIIAFMVGFFLSVYGYLISKFEVNPVSIAFFIWSILMFRNLSVTGFSDFLYNIHIIGLFSLFVLVLSLRGRISIRA
ncbi:MAG: oligosaccharide repeat unit polymerase [Marinobacter sp.]|nr:oligosaccharide repeat unit polymerase [Marinobacter sp.]